MVVTAAKQQIREMAYAKWRAAGCPENDARKYWREAELDVPNR